MDFARIGGPDEGLWLLVMTDDEAVDGALEIDDALAVTSADLSPIAFWHVWGCLWLASLSRMAWMAMPAGTSRSTAFRKRMNS